MKRKAHKTHSAADSAAARSPKTLTPTWRGVMPVLYTTAAQGVASAREELNRLADYGDQTPPLVRSCHEFVRAVDAALDDNGNLRPPTAESFTSPPLTPKQIKEFAQLLLPRLEGKS